MAGVEPPAAAAAHRRPAVAARLVPVADEIVVEARGGRLLVRRNHPAESVPGVAEGGGAGGMGDPGAVAVGIVGEPQGPARAALVGVGP